MKSFNEVRSDVSGTVVRYAVQNEDPVEAGQLLLQVQ